MDARDETVIRYRTNPKKVLEVLAWLVNARPGLSFYYIAKILYFADKAHLSRFGRPVLGDRYIAMEHGPVPSMVYDMLKLNPFLDPEMFEAIAKSINVVHNGAPTVWPLRQADISLLSRTDIDALRESLETFGDLTVLALRRMTHADRAWQEASANAEMDYALMLDESLPDRETKIKEIEAIAETLAL